MWLLSFIPDSILLAFVNAIFYLGVIFTVLGFVLRIPALATYRLIFQVVGVIALGAGLYFKGGYEVESQWRARVQEQQAEIERLRAAQAEVNTKVVTEYIETVKTIKGKTNVIIEKVPEYISVKDDAGCTIPDGVRVLLNAAAKNELPQSTRGTDAASPSPVTATEQ